MDPQPRRVRSCNASHMYSKVSLRRLRIDHAGGFFPSTLSPPAIRSSVDEMSMRNPGSASNMLSSEGGILTSLSVTKRPSEPRRPATRKSHPWGNEEENETER